MKSIISAIIATIAASIAEAKCQESREVYAIIVGNHDYSENKTFSDIPKADEWAKKISDQIGNTFRGANIKLLNKAVTKQAFSDSLETFGKRINPDDFLFVYFIGHGERPLAHFKRKDLSLYFEDSRNKSDGLTLGALLSDIFSYDENINLGMFLDCCNSGSESLTQYDQYIPPQAYYRSFILASCAPNEVSFNCDFTSTLLKIWRDNKIKPISPKKLEELLDDELKGRMDPTFCFPPKCDRKFLSFNQPSSLLVIKPSTQCKAKIKISVGDERPEEFIPTSQFAFIRQVSKNGKTTVKYSYDAELTSSQLELSPGPSDPDIILRNIEIPPRHVIGSLEENSIHKQIQNLIASEACALYSTNKYYLSEHLNAVLDASAQSMQSEDFAKKIAECKSVIKSGMLGESTLLALNRLSHSPISVSQKQISTWDGQQLRILSLVNDLNLYDEVDHDLVAAALPNFERRQIKNDSVENVLYASQTFDFQQPGATAPDFFQFFKFKPGGRTGDNSIFGGETNNFYSYNSANSLIDVNPKINICVTRVVGRASEKLYVKNKIDMPAQFLPDFVNTFAASTSATNSALDLTFTSLNETNKFWAVVKYHEIEKNNILIDKLGLGKFKEMLAVRVDELTLKAMEHDRFDLNSMPVIVAATCAGFYDEEGEKVKYTDELIRRPKSSLNKASP